jgi:hypothetical protein
MVIAPYLLLGVFGLFVYRGFKKVRQAEIIEEAKQAQPIKQTQTDDSPGPSPT